MQYIARREWTGERLKNHKYATCAPPVLGEMPYYEFLTHTALSTLHQLIFSPQQITMNIYVVWLSILPYVEINLHCAKTHFVLYSLPIYNMQITTRKLIVLCDSSNQSIFYGFVQAKL